MRFTSCASSLFCSYPVGTLIIVFVRLFRNVIQISIQSGSQFTFIIIISQKNNEMEKQTWEKHA